MKIIVKAEKAGQMIAQTIFEVKKPERILKRARKAFEAFREEHRDVPIFDDDVRVKFEKAESQDAMAGRPKPDAPKKRRRHTAPVTPLRVNKRTAARGGRGGKVRVRLQSSSASAAPHDRTHLHYQLVSQRGTCLI
jgi:hypothetical protein